MRERERVVLCSLSSLNITSDPFPSSNQFHFLGNMFMARCDYVKKLYPPKHFKTVRNSIFEHMYHSEGGTAEHAAGRCILFCF